MSRLLRMPNEGADAAVPEKEIVSVPAQARYYEPARPLVAETTERLSAQHAADDVLDLADVTCRAAT